MSTSAHAWGHSPRMGPRASWGLGALSPEGQRESSTPQCRDCLAGLEHCHGTVIHHARHRSECTEASCVTPEVVHRFSVDCDAIGCSCAGAVSAHRVG